ncbi:NMD3 family-domain-containing protein, partial [Amanita rubescens]
KASVQVRQKVQHKRTFLFLEQLILKHGAQKDTVSVKEVRDGLDFFYASRSHAIKMVEFLGGVSPVRSKTSEQLLSTDTHSNTANFKYTYSVEIAPICKDDLVCLPIKLARSLSNISPLVICARVGSSVIVLDPATLQQADIPAQVYWRAPFESLASISDLVEFTVLDVEVDRKQPHRGGGGHHAHGKAKYLMADAHVALAGAFRSSGNKGSVYDQDGMMDFESLGETNQIYHTRTHLGAILQPGDTVLGYHLTLSNFNSPEYAALKVDRVPDVVLVKKTYPNGRKKSKTRAWRLKSMAKEVEEEESGKGAGRGGLVGRMGGRDQKKVEEDYELFLRDLEEDEELRKEVNLYKVKGDVTMKGPGAGKAVQFGMDVDEGGEEEEDDADFPEVKLDELLDDFDEMALRDE